MQEGTEKMRKTEEMIQYLVEQRLTGYSVQRMKDENENADAELEAAQEWRELLEDMEPKMRKRMEKQYDRFLEQKDKELEEVYLFGLKDGLWIMKHIQEIRHE